MLNIRFVSALAGIVSPLLIGVIDLVSIFSIPGYNPFVKSVSDLALTRLGWLQTTGFILSGLLVIMLAVGLYSSISKRRGFKTGIAFLAFCSFSLVIIGIFHKDPTGTAMTTRGMIHWAGAFVVFQLFPLVCFLLAPSLKADPRWKSLFAYTTATGIIAVILIAIGWCLGTDFHWFGLFERILATNQGIWLEVISIRLLLLSHHPFPNTPLKA